ncbi:uncharacterized protein LOC118420030 [Branchiostoma floridae]|uniref:Uncharacterized protein LOC118420030 n=1 Tax=Branchiostoma floridae TaxID=7739 RepID=A0A9J7LGU9_BRAFL|nr:uncharacterized protein LOC118420030 [Branchiostoma floridae]
MDLRGLSATNDTFQCHFKLKASKEQNIAVHPSMNNAQPTDETTRADIGQGEDKGQGDNMPLFCKSEPCAAGTCHIQRSTMASNEALPEYSYTATNSMRRSENSSKEPLSKEMCNTTTEDSTMGFAGELVIDENAAMTTVDSSSRMSGNPPDDTPTVMDTDQTPVGDIFDILQIVRRVSEDANLALGNGDLNSAETNFAAALQVIHEPCKPVLHAEAYCLHRLGDVYKERGKRIRDGGVFNQSAALYNAALVRTEDEESKQKLLAARNEVEPLFLTHTANIHLEQTWHHVVIDHKKELEDMRRYTMSQLEIIHKENNPYLYHENDKVARKVEVQRAYAVKNLFKTVARDRQRLLQVLVEECITQLGPPPCKYALIALGLQSAELATLYSELDFAILIEDGQDNHDTQWYFRKLSWYLNLKVINLGETTVPSLAITSLNDYRNEDPSKDWFLDFVTPPGFAFDGYLNKNPAVTLTNSTDTRPLGCLVLTPRNLAELQQRDVLLREGHHLSDILRRVTYLAGGQDLVDEYVEKVNSTPEQSACQARLLGRLTSPDAIHEIDTDMYMTRLLNTKKDMYRFPITAIEALGLVCGISSASTWTVIEELEKGHHISKADANHLTVMTSISAEIQMRTHAANGGRHESLSELLALKSQTTAQETHGTVLRSTFHIPHPRMLFRYFFTAIPLRRRVLDILEDSGSVQTEPVLRATIFDSSALCRAEMARDLYLLGTSASESEAALRVAGAEKQQQGLLIAELGATRKKCADLKEAISLYSKSLAIWKCISNTNAEDGNIAQRHVASLLNSLGMLWSEQNDDRKAIKFYEQALEIRGAHTEHMETAMLLNNIALSWWKLGDDSKATSFFEQSLVILKSVYKANMIHTSIAACLCNLGVVWGKRGDHTKAMMYMKECLRMKRAIYGDNRAHPDIASLLHELGSCSSRLGGHVKGTLYFQQSIKVLRVVHQEKGHADIARGLISLGSCCSKVGDHAKAICYVEQSLEMHRALIGDTSHLTIATLHRKLGSLWSLSGNHLEAIKHNTKSLNMMTFLYGEETAHADIAALLNNLGVSWCKLGDEERAMQNHQHLPEMIRSIYGAGTTPSSRDAGAYHNLQLDRTPHHCGEDYEKAMSYFEQSLKMRNALYGAKATHSDIASSLNNVGSVWSKLGDHTKAIQCKEMALRMRKAIHRDKAQPEIAALLNDLGTSWWKNGDKKKALGYFEQCLVMTRAIHQRNNEQHPAIAGALNNLAMCLREVGIVNTAIDLFAQSAAMLKAVCGDYTAHVTVSAPLINFGLTWDKRYEYNKGQILKERTLSEKIAMSLTDLGSSFFKAGFYRKALTYYEQSILVLQAIHGVQTNNEDIARLLGHVGLCWSELGQQTKAKSYVEQSLNMQRILFADSPERPDMAISLSRLASIWGKLGKHRQEISCYEESLRIMEIVIGDNAAHPQIATTLNSLASAWSKVGDYRNAISCEEQSLKMKKTMYGDSTVHPDIAASLGSLGLYWSKVGDHTKVVGYYEHLLGMLRILHKGNGTQPHIATILGSLGSSWSKLGDQRKAIAYHEQALNVLKAMHGETAQQPEIATALYNLGVQWCEIGDYYRAVTYHEQSLHMRRAMYGKKAAHPDIATSLNSLGATWGKQGDQRKSVACYEMSLQTIRQLCGENMVHSEIAEALSNLGTACTDLGDYQKATRYYEQALKMQEAIYGEKTPHPNIASLCGNLGSSWIRLGDQRRATDYSEMLLAMIRTVEGENKTAHPGIVMALSNLGQLWTKLGDHGKAVKYYEDALKMRQRLCGESLAHRETAALLCNLGLSWNKLGDQQKAVTCFEQFLEMTKRIKGQITAHPGIAEILDYMGSMWTKLGDYGKAKEYYEQALDMLQTLHGPTASRPDIATTLNNLGSTWGKLGQQSKAITYMEMSLTMRRAMYGEDIANPDIARLINNIGTACCQLGDKRTSISYFEQSLKMMKRVYGENTAHPDIVATLDNLGLSWGQLGDQLRSISYKEESLKMMKAIYGENTATAAVATSPDSLAPHLGDTCARHMH